MIDRLASAGPIRAITLDVGGTLIEPWPSVGHVYSEVAAQFGLHLSPSEITTAFASAWKERQNFRYTRGEWFEVVCKSFGCDVSPEIFEAIYKRFAEPFAWRVFDDVLPALQLAQARNLKVAVISNWDERLKPLLQAMGLIHFFDHVLVSAEIGARKPEPKIFLQAAHLLNLAPRSVLHIGDSDEEDLLGATSAGFQSMKVDRPHRSLMDILRSI